MTIVELREKRAKLWATMEGFLDTHRDRKGILSAEDDAVYSNMEKELNDLTNEVRRMERRDAIAAELAKPVSSPITEQPQKATGEAKTGRASNAYREDFGLHLRGKRMLHNLLSEGVDANGGYLVPTEFEKFIVDTLKEENVMRRLCKVITTDNERIRKSMSRPIPRHPKNRVNGGNTQWITRELQSSPSVTRNTRCSSRPRQPRRSPVATAVWKTSVRS